MNALQLTHFTVGAVILLSIAAHWYTNSGYALLLPILMGVGLVRASITGNCPMTNFFMKRGAKQGDTPKL